MSAQLNSGGLVVLWQASCQAMEQRGSAYGACVYISAVVQCVVYFVESDVGLKQVVACGGVVLCSVCGVVATSSVAAQLRCVCEFWLRHPGGVSSCMLACSCAG